MRHRLFMSMFTGGGGADEGARQAGYDVIAGIEISPDLAAIAQENHPSSTVHVADVADVDYRPWHGIVDHLHASPSCKGASSANPNRGETEGDVAAGRAVVRAIEEILPHSFSLENVRGYATATGQDGQIGFVAYRLILSTLRRLGYGLTAGFCLMADYGVPQSRERLIVVAIRGLPDVSVTLPAPTHVVAGTAAPPQQLGLFDAAVLTQREPWPGWYPVLEEAGIIPVLPPSALAPWQIARLPTELRDHVLVEGQNANAQRGPIYRDSETIAPAVTAKGRSRAVLMQSRNAGESFGAQARSGSDPSPTVTPISFPSHMPRAVLIEGTQGGASNCYDLPMPLGDEPSFTVKSTVYKGMPRAMLLDGQPSLHGTRMTVADGDDPSFTVLATTGTRKAMRAVLIGGGNSSQQQVAPGVGVRDADEPSLCVLGSSRAGRWRLILPYRVVSLTPLALSVFQSFPTTYRWPRRSSQRRLRDDQRMWLDTTSFTTLEAQRIHDWIITHDSRACEAIGNAVPPRFMALLLQHIESLARNAHGSSHS